MGKEGIRKGLPYTLCSTRTPSVYIQSQLLSDTQFAVCAPPDHCIIPGQGCLRCPQSPTCAPVGPGVRTTASIRAGAADVAPNTPTPSSLRQSTIPVAQPPDLRWPSPRICHSERSQSHLDDHRCGQVPPPWLNVPCQLLGGQLRVDQELHGQGTEGVHT